MPAIPSSGAVSLTDLSTEFGGTAPHSMSEYYRNGDNVPDNNSNVPTSGRIRFSDWRGAINQIALNAINATNLDVSTLFGSDWTSTVPKKLTVGSGVTIGGTGSSAALIIPSNLAGTLEIYNVGNIIGFGGSANGGAGGDAISNAASGVTVTNLGLLAGGGGGGGEAGNGGTGGGGRYSTTSAQYQGTSAGKAWDFSDGGCFNVSRCGSFTESYQVGQKGTQVCRCKYGNTAYRSGTHTCQSNDDAYYSAKCYKSVTSNTNTNGGSGGNGGNGGVGQGYNQSNTNGSGGSGGSSGGTNAGNGGSGGTGGNGGTYGSSGASGATGNTGANGNRTNGSSGSSGSSGGAAGAAVAGTTITMNNSGTLHGAVA